MTKLFDSFPKPLEDKPIGQWAANMQANQPFLQRTLKGDIGLEFELEGLNLPEAPLYSSPTTNASWMRIKDDSLRGGYEYIISQPLLLEELDAAIQALITPLAHPSVRIIPSNRMSTHVHINAQGMKVNELTSFFCLWNMFETSLIRWCGDDRVGNLFCLGGADTPWTIDQWLNFVQTGVIDDQANNKYTALNINTLSRKGSFEFRCLRGLTDLMVARHWAKFLLGLRNYAVEHYRSPSKMAEEISETSPLDIFKNVCDYTGQRVFYEEVLQSNMHADVNEQMWSGFRRIQPILFAFDWDRFLPEIEAEYISSGPFAQHPLKVKMKQEPMPLEVLRRRPGLDPIIREDPRAPDFNAQDFQAFINNEEDEVEQDEDGF